jgi:lysozyme
VITNLVDQLRRDEGEVLHAYQDSKGFWTIGVGICIDSRVNCGITAEESAYLLQNRIANTTVQLQTNLPWFSALDPIRQEALINATFNMGIGHLLGFHNTLSLLQQSNWDAAAQEMLNSSWAKEVPARAQRLAQQIRTGQRQ